MLLLNQITDNFVIEIRNVLPLYALLLIFLLFRPQCEFDEELLQFLIAEVDAQLLETEIQAAKAF